VRWLKKSRAYWYKAQVYLDIIKRQKDVDIKTSDNKYHCTTKVGKKKTSVAHKYSDHFLDLIERIDKGEDYELDM
jgi:hypothetical protein